MTDATELPLDGLVIYTDGSFRKQRAGWGLHAYTFSNTPAKKGIGVKNTYPTSKGYQKVSVEESVEVLAYYDHFGPVVENPTNNTGELQAVIEAFRFAQTFDVSAVTIYADSQYVIKGLTKHVKNWIRNDWKKKDGEPVANQGLWQALVAERDAWKALGRTFKLEHVDGHSGNVGNDRADYNARSGSGGGTPTYPVVAEPQGYHNPKNDLHPLFLKTRMVFNIGTPAPEEDGHYYYTYHLGQQRLYGHKQGDSKRDKYRKNDLLFGRRISDASFAVIRTESPVTFLDHLQSTHAQHHTRDVVDVAIARLDNATKPAMYQHLERFGEHAVEADVSIGALISPHDDLIVKTHTPPRLARDGLQTFNRLQKTLDQYRTGTLGPKVHVLDITSTLYQQEAPKANNKKTPPPKLRSDITNQTLTHDVAVTYQDHDLTLRLLLGTDIPQRNTLAKIAEENPTVTVLVVPEGPEAYSFATIFDVGGVKALYQSPYTQFVTPKRKGS